MSLILCAATAAWVLSGASAGVQDDAAAVPALRFEVRPDHDEVDRNEVVEAALRHVRRHVDQAGLRSIRAEAQQGGVIAVFAGDAERDALARLAPRLLQRTTLEFRLVADESTGVDLAAYYADLHDDLETLQQPLTDAWLRQRAERLDDGRVLRFARAHPEFAAELDLDMPFVLLEEHTAFTFGGTDLAQTYVTSDERRFPALGFELRPDRAQAFAAYTGAHEGRRMAIVVDGQVLTAPVLRGPIGERGIIQGGQSGFTEEELGRLDAALARALIPAEFVRLEG